MYNTAASMEDFCIFVAGGLSTVLPLSSKEPVGDDDHNDNKVDDRDVVHSFW